MKRRTDGFITVMVLLTATCLPASAAAADWFLDRSQVDFLMLADPATGPSYAESFWYPQVVQATVGGFPKRANIFGRWPDYLIASMVTTQGPWHSEYDNSIGMVLSKAGEILVPDRSSGSHVFRRIGTFDPAALANAERNHCRFQARLDPDVEFDFSIQPVPFYSNYYTTMSFFVKDRPVVYTSTASLTRADEVPDFLAPWQAAAPCTTKNLFNWHMANSRLP